MLLDAVVLPMLAAALALLPSAVWPRRSQFVSTESGERGVELTPATAWSSGVAYACAYLVSHLRIHGRPASTQLEAWEWLLLLVPAAAVASVLTTVSADQSTQEGTDKDARGGLKFAVVGLAISAASGWCLVPSFQSNPWFWRILLGVSTFCMLLAQRYFAYRLPPVSILVAWILVAASCVPVFIASANAKFGLFAVSIAAASGAWILIGVASRALRRWVPLAKPLEPAWVVSVIFPALSFSSYFNDYGDVPFYSFMLLAAAPLALGLGIKFTSASESPWRTVISGISAVVVFCAAAVYLAWPALTASPAY